MAPPSARSRNFAQSRRAGDGPPCSSIPSRTAPAQRIPTRCLSYSKVSIPKPRSNSHCLSTSLAASPAAWGSRWHYPTRDQEIPRIADVLETCRYTARPRRVLPPRDASTSCLSYSRVSIPNPHSHSHCSSTSLAASPAAWGSRWHHPTRY